MARNSYFQFKQFSVEQGRCAMKVTIDACLLGAMADVEEAENILDIGTGTGLLSLMAAQHSKAMITAVELDKEAFEQACDNFADSPWPERLTAIHSSIQSFTEVTTEQFDAVICNPPFFHNCLKPPQQQRAQARHTDTLNFDELARSISVLLKNTGQAWLLIPVEFSYFVTDAMQKYGLEHYRVINLSSSEDSPPHRHIVVASRLAHQNINQESIHIYQTPLRYSEMTYSLLKPYHLYL